MPETEYGERGQWQKRHKWDRENDGTLLYLDCSAFFQNTKWMACIVCKLYLNKIQTPPTIKSKIFSSNYKTYCSYVEYINSTKSWCINFYGFLEGERCNYIWNRTFFFWRLIHKSLHKHDIKPICVPLKNVCFEWHLQKVDGLAAVNICSISIIWCTWEINLFFVCVRSKKDSSFIN